MYSQRPSIVKARAWLAMPDLTSEEIAAATQEFAESVSNPQVKALLLKWLDVKNGRQRRATHNKELILGRDPRLRRYRPGKSFREKKARDNSRKIARISWGGVEKGTTFKASCCGPALRTTAFDSPI